MLTLTATQWAGEGVTGANPVVLSDPVALIMRKNEGMPCDELTAVFCCEKPLGELCEVTLCNGGTTLFTGIVDRQRQRIGAAGQTVALECRSIGALLLDNEAIPRTHYYARLSDIVRSHAAEFGIKGVRGDDPFLSRYAVTKGFSVWRAVSLFCRRALGRSPRVMEDGYLDTRAPVGGRVEVSNRLDSGQRYVQVVSDTDRCEVLSCVKAQTSGSYYGAAVANADARGVRRTRLIVPAAEWANLPRQSAQELVRQSMHRKRRVAVTLPGLVPWDIGDLATLCDEPFAGLTLTVGELEYRVNEGGLVTTAVLYDGTYR